jgi:hypothetical protein
MARVYELVVVKDGKEIIVEESNHWSQMISERNWETRGARGPLRGCDPTKEELEVFKRGR